ncbi:hypothetical protein CR513_03326, partial [Mucuna pruriens]
MKKATPILEGPMTRGKLKRIEEKMQHKLATLKGQEEAQEGIVLYHLSNFQVGNLRHGPKPNSVDFSLASIFAAKPIVNFVAKSIARLRACLACILSLLCFGIQGVLEQVVSSFEIQGRKGTTMLEYVRRGVVDPCESWYDLKRLMRKRFVPPSYTRDLHNKL